MFTDFRINAKKTLYDRQMTYSQLSEKTGIAESTIKCFMCGANDSRRIAEKIADALDCNLVYSNGIYNIVSKGVEEHDCTESYRRKKGLTQKQIAKALGVVPSCVTQWESGVRCPNVVMLKKLAELLECTADELLEPISCEGDDRMTDEKIDLVDLYLYKTAVKKVLREYLSDRLAKEISSQITLEFCRLVSKQEGLE